MLGILLQERVRPSLPVAGVMASAVAEDGPPTGVVSVDKAGSV